jgi:4-amino-4-deoxy-L-arabinose transferase-like glycosyltransferase
VLVGLGLNIKMLQALLPLPAFYLIYLIYLMGGRVAPWRRITCLGLATAMLLWHPSHGRLL